MNALMRMQHNQVLRLVDNPDVPEIYADNFSGLVFTNGNLNLTFAVVRADHAKEPGNNNFRQVVGRLVLPANVAAELHAMLGQVMGDLEKQGLVKRAPSLEVVQ